MIEIAELEGALVGDCVRIMVFVTDMAVCGRW